MWWTHESVTSTCCAQTPCPSECQPNAPKLGFRAAEVSLVSIKTLFFPDKLSSVEISAVLLARYEIGATIQRDQLKCPKSVSYEEQLPERKFLFNLTILKFWSISHVGPKPGTIAALFAKTRAPRPSHASGRQTYETQTPRSRCKKEHLPPPRDKIKSEIIMKERVEAINEQESLLWDSYYCYESKPLLEEDGQKHVF